MGHLLLELVHSFLMLFFLIYFLYYPRPNCTVTKDVTSCVVFSVSLMERYWGTPSVTLCTASVQNFFARYPFSLSCILGCMPSTLLILMETLGESARKAHGYLKGCCTEGFWCPDLTKDLLNNFLSLKQHFCTPSPISIWFCAPTAK